MKNALESLGKRADHMEERLGKLEDRNLERIQVEEERELRLKKRKNSENCSTPLEWATQ